MPKVEISSSKGLVQSTGSGLHLIEGTLADSTGIHTYQEVVTIAAAGMGNAKAEALLSKSLPAGSSILFGSLTLLQAAGGAAGAGVTVSLHNASNVALGAAGGGQPGSEIIGANSTLTTKVAEDLPVGTGATVGDTVTCGVGDVGANVFVYVNSGGDNSSLTGTIKLLVSVVYSGKGEPAVIA